MKKEELKDLEFFANGVLIENESIERLESDRRKRLLAESFVAVRNMTGMNRKEFAEWLAIPYRTMQDWELHRCRSMFLDLWRIRCLWKRRGGIYNPDIKGNSAVSNQIGAPARSITFTRCSLFLGRCIRGNTDIID